MNGEGDLMGPIKKNSFPISWGIKRSKPADLPEVSIGYVYLQR